MRRSCAPEKKNFSLRLGEFSGAGEAQIAERLRRIREGYVRPKVHKLCAEYPEEFSREEIQEWLALLWDENSLSERGGGNV